MIGDFLGALMPRCYLNAAPYPALLFSDLVAFEIFEIIRMLVLPLPSSQSGGVKSSLSFSFPPAEFNRIYGAALCPQ